MKIHIKIKWYKRSLRNRDPIRFHASQPKGVGTDAFVTIKADPILKKHPDLKDALFKHEMDEVRSWAMGKKASHKQAKSHEPKNIRNIGGVTGFWREIERREKIKGRRITPKTPRITPPMPRLR